MSPTPNARPTGFPSHDAPEGVRYEASFVPTSGFTLASALRVGPQSIVSGQNVWTENGELVPRWKLSRETIANPVVIGGSVIGTAVYNSVGIPVLRGPFYVLGDSNGSLWLGTRDGSSNLSFSLLSYTSSTGTSLPLENIPANTNIYGATVYSAATDRNILMLSAGTTLTYCFALNAATPPVYSHVTQAPGAKGIATLANRAVAWGCATVASPSHIQQRVQWSVAGDPFDWTGIGSGSEDLVDMQGSATRIFVQNDELILATDREIWRGRYVGQPYDFQFSPITNVGIPYQSAAIQTPYGIFWLGEDLNVYTLRGDEAVPIGTAFQPILRREMRVVLVAQPAANLPFFTYNEELQHLRLWYALGSAGGAATRSITMDLANQSWWRDHYNHSFTFGNSAPVSQLRVFNSVSANNLWHKSELLFTSAATACYFAESATSDLDSKVTQVAQLGALFPDDARYLKTLKEVRLELRGDGTSQVTVGVSPNVGSTYSETKTLTVSSSSFPVQSALTFDTEARYPTMRLTSESTNRWRLAMVYTMAERQGR